MVEEDGVPPTRAPLRLKDLDKFWVPMQLEMERIPSVIRSRLFVVGMIPCFHVAQI